MRGSVCGGVCACREIPVEGRSVDSLSHDGLIGGYGLAEVVDEVEAQSAGGHISEADAGGYHNLLNAIDFLRDGDGALESG